MSLFSLCPLLIGEAGETQDHSRQGLPASVLSFLPKAQGQHEAREGTNYEIVLLKPITGATELRLLGNRGKLKIWEI